MSLKKDFVPKLHKNTESKNPMPWYLLALIPPLFWAGTNLVDQFIVRRYFPDKSAACLFFSCISNGVFALLFLLFNPDVLDVPIYKGLLLSLIGTIYVFGSFPYIWALQEKDASRCLPAFQIIPFFALLLESVFLGIEFQAKDIIAGAIIMGGTITVAWEFCEGKLHVRPFLYVTAAAFMYAMYSVLLKVFSIDFPWYTSMFWVTSGWAVTGIIYMAFSSTLRNTIVRVMRDSKGAVLFWDFVQQGFDVVATSIYISVLAMAPSVTHVMLVDGVHPLYILFIGGAMGVILPQYYERLSIDKYLIYRLIGAVIMFTGLYILLFVS